MPSGTGIKTHKKIKHLHTTKHQFQVVGIYAGVFYVSLLRTAALGLLCNLNSTFQLSPPGFSTRTTTRGLPAAEDGTMGEKCPGILPK
jgi:hypothetical protein